MGRGCKSISSHRSTIIFHRFWRFLELGAGNLSFAASLARRRRERRSSWWREKLTVTILENWEVVKARPLGMNQSRESCLFGWLVGQLFPIFFPHQRTKSLGFRFPKVPHKGATLKSSSQKGLGSRGSTQRFHSQKFPGFLQRLRFPKVPYKGSTFSSS